MYLHYFNFRMKDPIYILQILRCLPLHGQIGNRQNFERCFFHQTKIWRKMADHMQMGIQKSTLQHLLALPKFRNSSIKTMENIMQNCSFTVWLVDFTEAELLLISSFSLRARSKGSSPKPLQIALQQWEWKNKAIPIRNTAHC